MSRGIIVPNSTFMKTQQEIRDFIKRNYLSMTDEEMGSELGLTAEQVRNRRRTMKLTKVYNKQNEHLVSQEDRESPDSVTAIEQEEKPKFFIKGGNVEWTYRHGIMEIPIETLDQIFYEYSVHGLNLSQVKIQNKHGFNAIQWQSFKRTFDLVKDSDVFSPYTLSLYSEKEQCDMIANKISEKYSPKNMRDVIVYEDEKQRKKAYDTAIKTASKIDLRRQEFETELLDYVSSLPKKVSLPISKASKIDKAIIHVCDIHIGAEIEEVKQNGRITQQSFNSDIALERLLNVAKDANEKQAKDVTIVINGDIIETFTGLNHINSWKGIDKRYGYGTKATIKAIEILDKFIQNVHNVSKVILISGNHDRTTSNNSEDVDGEIIYWVHFTLKAMFGKLIDIEFSTDITAHKIGNVGFLFTHGHLGLSKKDPSNIVLDYGFGEHIYHMIVEGHLHTRKVKHDSLNRRVIVAPSIFTGNNYSKQGGWSTLPGYLFFFTKGDYPVVYDIPIP